MTLIFVTVVSLLAASVPLFVAVAVRLLLAARPAASLTEAAEALAIVLSTRRRHMALQTGETSAARTQGVPHSSHGS